MNCSICPVACNADRSKTQGYCGAAGIKIAKYYLHPYEEPPVSFKNGSGCVFFCGCSLKCVFCQNYDLSRNNRGKEISVEELAKIFKELEDMGADNINLVNPTHYVKEIAAAFAIYKPKIPVVYNTHSYETVQSLKIAQTFTDIYLPDLKFLDPLLSKRYTGKANYAEYAIPAIKLMAQQPLKFDKDGKMLSGCIIRHLILPLASYDSVKVVEFIKTLPPTVYLSLMSQYTPFGDIQNYKELQRKITKREYEKVLTAVQNAQLKNVFLQDSESSGEGFIPKWDF